MISESKFSDLEERCEPFQEILGKTPSWLVRWGISSIFIILLIAVFITWLIQYPDVIPARVTITTPKPPARIIARVDGKISTINVVENQLVDKGEVLAVLENPADYDSILDLKTILTNKPVNIEIYDYINQLNLPKLTNLGETQETYSTFQRNFYDFSYYNNTTSIDDEITYIDEQISQNQELLKKQFLQKKILAKEVKLTQNETTRSENLYKEKYFSITLLNEKKRELLRSKREYEEIGLDIDNTKINISELRQNRLRLHTNINQIINEKELLFNESYNNLLNSISAWENKFVLKSPIRGRVSIFKIWSDLQNVKQGDEVLIIVPNEKQPIIGKVIVPLLKSGKTAVGQKVFIRLDNYPYQEYGMVLGNVKSISLVPREESYTLEVNLPNKLHTSFGKELEFRQEMQGSAEIITEDLRLLERIFYQFRSIFISRE